MTIGSGLAIAGLWIGIGLIFRPSCKCKHDKMEADDV